MPVDVIFQPQGRRVRVDVGTTLLHAIQQAGLAFPGDCGGKGKCGKCAVQCSAGLAEPSVREQDILAEHQHPSGVRLACLATLSGNATVTIPARYGLGGDKGAPVVLPPLAVDARVRSLRLTVPTGTVDEPLSLLDRLVDAARREGAGRLAVPTAVLRALPARFAGGELRAVLIDGELVAIDQEFETGLYGVAVDIGTTTLVAYLLDLQSGACLGVESMENPQTAFGGDVLSRISAARHDPAKLAELHRTLLGGLDHLLEALLSSSGMKRDEVWDVVVAGNTTMLHFFLGISPASLAVIPYSSLSDAATDNGAPEVGLSLRATARVRTLPGCRSFVGADTVAAVLASGMQRSHRCRLLLDVGTNGEIVVGSRDRLLSCSTAAGPAFEGAKIEFGLRAVAGAVDRVTAGDDLEVSTIAGAAPIGICGSGVIDAVHACRQAGLIEANGNIAARHANPQLGRRIVPWGRGRAIVLARSDGLGREIVFTQQDVREVQLAKGAIRAGIELLMAELGVSPDELSEVVLAGAFGSYIRPESAIGIGLLPAVPLERVRGVGNAAGRGAQMALLSKAAYRESLALAAQMTYVPLSSQPAFQRRFIAAMTFPGLPVRSKGSRSSRKDAKS